MLFIPFELLPLGEGKQFGSILFGELGSSEGFLHLGVGAEFYTTPLLIICLCDYSLFVVCVFCISFLG